MSSHRHLHANHHHCVQEKQVAQILLQRVCQWFTFDRLSRCQRHMFQMFPFFMLYVLHSYSSPPKRTVSQMRQRCISSKMSIEKQSKCNTRVKIGTLPAGTQKKRLEYLSANPRFLWPFCFVHSQIHLHMLEVPFAIG